MSKADLGRFRVSMFGLLVKVSGGDCQIEFRVLWGERGDREGAGTGQIGTEGEEGSDQEPHTWGAPVLDLLKHAEVAGLHEHVCSVCLK